MMSLTSRHSFGMISIFSLFALIARPTHTATNTIASTPPLFVNADVMLDGTVFRTISSGLEPDVPVLAEIPASSVWNIPIL